MGDMSLLGLIAVIVFGVVFYLASNFVTFVLDAVFGKNYRIEYLSDEGGYKTIKVKAKGGTSELNYELSKLSRTELDSVNICTYKMVPK